jgi:PBP1b-binding outer membrane lipoprotein LpoB
MARRGLFYFGVNLMKRVSLLLLALALLMAGCFGDKPSGKNKDQDKPKTTNADW